MQARFANGLFDGRWVVGDSTPAFGASVGHAIAVVWNVEKPMGAAVAESVTLECFVLREAGAKEVVIGLVHVGVPPVDVFIVADCVAVVQ